MTIVPLGGETSPWERTWAPVWRVDSVPRAAEEGRGRDPFVLLRQAALVAAYAAVRPVSVMWSRAASGDPLSIVVAGVGRADGDDLGYPPGARGTSIPPTNLSSVLGSFSAWRAAQVRQRPGPPQLKVEETTWRPTLEDAFGQVWTDPFAFVVLAVPVPPDRIVEERERIEATSRSPTRSGAGFASESEMLGRRYRELDEARTTGLWEVAVLAGGRTESDAAAALAVSVGGLDLQETDYLLEEASDGWRTNDGGLLKALREHHHLAVPTAVLARLARPPIREIAGVRAVTPPRFDVVVENPGEIPLGKVIDRSGQILGPMLVGRETLNRHTFVCGATGAGKSQTVRGLLETLSRMAQPVHWLVVEPAKAEYARMAGRLVGVDKAAVTVIAPGDPHAPPGSLNPLEPGTLELGNPDRTFPLQGHADLVRALFLAAFEAQEPFPQVLSQALTECYARAGWDLVTGEPLVSWEPSGTRRDHEFLGNGDERSERDLRVPRYPSLGDLQQSAKAVVSKIGYDEQIKQRVTGFVDVRIGSLRLGSAGRFFEGGHRLDVAQLLQRNIVLEIERVTNDQDKAFVMGAVLIRLYEQLLLEEKERFDKEGPPTTFRHVTVVEEAHRLLRNATADPSAAHALEIFANLLAEVRAYGEGIVIAEQIPSKLLPDVIKNTALKIMHRLPAADDRAAVGATINLSQEQSEYVVTLPPGTAAVFTDGMDRPLLVGMDLNEDREDPRDASHNPPLAARRSSACAGECRATACTLTQIRHAERVLEDHPELTLWMEVACVAHIGGLPPPLFAASRAVEELRHANRRIVECAIAHAVEQALEPRYVDLKEFFDPDALGDHLAQAAAYALWPEGADPCETDDGRWRAGRQRFSDLEQALSKVTDAASLTEEAIRQRAQQRGLTLVGHSVEEDRAHLQSLEFKRYSTERQLRIRLGDRSPSSLAVSAAKLAGTTDPSALVRATCEVLSWQDSEHGEALIRLSFPNRDRAESPTENRGTGGS